MQKKKKKHAKCVNFAKQEELNFRYYITNLEAIQTCSVTSDRGH